MKKKIIILVILNLCVFNITWSQDLLSFRTETISSNPENPIKPLNTFEFKAYNKDTELEKISVDLSGAHPFGLLTSKKLYLFEKSYTSQVALIPGNPQTKTVIKKPLIYSSVKKIEKHLLKSVKKGFVTNELASSEFNKTLDVALNILTTDTKKFEDELTATKSIDEKLNLFTNRVKLNY